jgi:hypothetical protein
MSKSMSVTFRIPSDLADEFMNAVTSSDVDKTSWLVDALRQKLNHPANDVDARMIALVERMEAAASTLIAGK